MKYILNLQELEKYYTIYNDGRIFNKLTSKWLRPHYNNYGYLYVWISKGVDHVRFISIHTLVAYKYIGPPPTKSHEIDHIDQDRSNNNSYNLQWITHSANILKSYETGRDHFWLGKRRPSPSTITLMLMADAKKKKILYKSATQEIIYDSIEEAASRLNTYRKKIYLSIRDQRSIQGGFLAYYIDQGNTP